jgi:ribonuclease BN (tRNA processing enzyme)
MSNPAYLNDRELVALSDEIRRSRVAVGASKFFTSTKPPDRDGELEVLRRWNSHSPMVNSEYGGAYFLRWNGRGIVIDPGCTFLEVFRQRHLQFIAPKLVTTAEAHCMDDVDLVIATHDHADHCEDLAILLVLLRAYNEWKKHREGKTYRPHKIDLILSHGVYFRNHTVLEHPENRRLLNVCKVMPTRPVSRELDHQHVGAEYRLDVDCIRTQHHEIMGDHTGFGLRLKLRITAQSTFTICDSGDTGFTDELSPQYEGADLLILHVGTLEDLSKRKPEPSEHLCFDGIVKVLNGLKKPPRLVLLGEWGEEFRIPAARKRFAEAVQRHVAIDSPILPADLGMRIRIPDCHVWCDGAFRAPQDVKVEDAGQWLRYYC